MSGLLATKLHCPSLPKKYVPRPQLLRRLDEGWESGRQIVLVSAPAGFGKTACLSEWVATLGVPVAWLSLDPADDDPGRFFTYLIAALQKMDASLGREIDGILRAGQLPPAGIISAALSNDILALENRFLLVLDDFQFVQDRFILGILEELIDNPPPALYLVLSTREDPSLPLARLRANDRLTEIRAADLRFSEPEAERFLNTSMGLSLSPADVAALETRTEGWVVGLHLAGLSIRERGDPSRFIAGLSGSHRFILNYLTEEVLARQPGEVQDFLSRTSILDRLNGDLCNAVTGRDDCHALLERLYGANLFLVPLDDEGHWYRYHQLFADLLRERKGTAAAEVMAECHRRASRWYAGAGMVSEAIEHALAAADYETAVGLIESHAMDMLMQWHLKTVEGWMRAIPPEWCAGSPSANLAFAWMYLQRNNFVQAAPYLERLQTMSPAEVDPSLQGKWLALQAMLLNARGRPADGLELAKRALSLAAKEDGRVRCMIQLAIAGACQQMDDTGGAMDAFQEIFQHGQAAGNSVYELLGVSGMALMAIRRGRLHFAFDLASQGIARVERTGSMPPVSTAVYGELGTILYQWHQLEQAHAYFQKAIQVSVLSGHSDAKLFYGVILSRLHQIEGDLDAAAREIEEAVELMQVVAATVVRDEVIAQQVRIDLARDRLAAAEAALAALSPDFQDGIRLPDLPAGQDVSLADGLRYETALRLLLHRAQARGERDNLPAAVALADRMIDSALRHQYIPSALEMLLLRARLHAVQGETTAAQADYLRALELGEPEGFISAFVEEGPQVAEALRDLLEGELPATVRAEYVGAVLAAFPRSRADAVGLLTGRELDVLRLMAEGLRYEEIAARLYVSLNTVRSHVKAVYGKLGVDNRTKAVEVARQMHIL